MREGNRRAPVHDAIVVGAGVVGMSTALYLQDRGYSVLVVDPRKPGSACSSGNSGSFGIGLTAPIGMPGMLRQVPRLLLHPDEPLFIRPDVMLGHGALWFWQFARNLHRARVQTISAVRAALNARVLETLMPLVDIADCRALIHHRGMLFLFEADKPSPMAQARFDVSTAHGIDVRPLTRTDIEAMVPQAGSQVGCGVMIPGNWHCSNPAGLVDAYAGAFSARGGTIRMVPVSRIVPGDRPSVIADGVALHGRNIVLCAGVWSRELLRPLGYSVPMLAERGYHLMMPRSGITLGSPVTLADRNVVMTPMDGGLRLTGVSEFTPADAKPKHGRALRLARQARRYFPDLDDGNAEPWVGPRPSTPDSLPIVGRAPHHRGLFFAFGHGQSGLAHASVTGRIIADLIGGRPPLLDPAPIAFSRFERL